MEYTISIIIAFLVGYILGYHAGVWQQGNKDKKKMLDALDKVVDATRNHPDIKKPEFNNGAYFVNKLVYDAFVKVFYGENPTWLDDNTPK